MPQTAIVLLVGTFSALAPAQAQTQPEPQLQPQLQPQPPGALLPSIVGPAETSKLVTAADTRRADLESATLRERAAQASARGAETDKRSRLDVVSETYMSAVDEKKEQDSLDLRAGELWPWLWLVLVLCWLAEGLLANRTVA